MSEASSQVPKQRTILGHPAGLYVLFFTEMWERFSYYGMRALLVLYMVNYFKWTQEDASGIYKWYTSLVYLTPILGGFLADRYLGNKWAIIIGAILMSVGHFLMAFEDIWIFYAALGFLIMGNGFFKPNMSVQVGRLYPQNDPRRDGAYTIFYMGINLGAFLAPLVCGALKDTEGLGYHWGFGAAGVGMVIGLVTYVIGLPLIKELPANVVFKKEKSGEEKESDEEHVMTEAEAETAPSAIPTFSRLSPSVFTLLGVVVGIGAPIATATGALSFDNMIACLFGAGSLFFAAWILSQLSMAVRDRVLAIYALFMFVVFFWGAFEQAGNAMNVWADQTTNRHLGQEVPPTPSVYPDVHTDPAEGGYWKTAQNVVKKLVATDPVGTTSFQSINALAIVICAPMFAWLWLFLARRNVKLSIAGKMAIGVFLQGMAFALMMWATLYENGRSEVDLEQLPEGFEIIDGSVHFLDAPDLPESRDDFDKLWSPGPTESESAEEPEKMIAHGGRMSFDNGKLIIDGVLDQNHRDRILRATANPAYIKSAQDFALRSQEDKKAARDNQSDEEKEGDENVKFNTTWNVADVPASFDPNYFRGYDPEKFEVNVDNTRVSFSADTPSVVGATSVEFAVQQELADKDYKQLLVAGANPEFRSALNQLYQDSSKYRVSSAWLFWFYILCTLGELCLSPVGLSMVSKLAPRRFATMLMGVWLLTSFFGNFAAGLAGENWEYLAPRNYFMIITIVLLVASAICFFAVRKINAMMHGVR
ncbi:MAG: peptide MFS transporter [Pirellulales bacterium]|nr:peptide MFS transporter [Pirellulales bacterium]